MQVTVMLTVAAEPPLSVYVNVSEPQWSASGS